MVLVRAPALATGPGNVRAVVPSGAAPAHEEAPAPVVPNAGTRLAGRPGVGARVKRGRGRPAIAPPHEGATDRRAAMDLPLLVRAGIDEVARGRHLDGHGTPAVPGVPATASVLGRATALITGPSVHGLLVVARLPPVLLPTTEDDPVGEAALVVVLAARARRLVLPLGAPNALPATTPPLVHDPIPAGMGRACHASGPARHLPAMAAAAVPAPLGHGPAIGLGLLALQATTAIVRSRHLGPAVLPVPPLKCATHVVGGLILQQGTSGVARPHEVVEGAKGIPGPAMPRRMAAEANGVRSRAAAARPAVAGAPSDAMGVPIGAAPNGTGRAKAPVAATDARTTRVALEAEAGARAGPTVPKTPVATGASATAKLATVVAGEPSLPVAPLVPRKARVDGLGQAAHALHDAVQVPEAGGATIAAPSPVAPACQITTRAVRRLLRMQGGPATATAVVAARWSTRPRQAPGVWVLVLGLAAPQAMPSGAPAAKLEDVGVLARTAAEAPLPYALREVRSPRACLVAGRRPIGATLLTGTLKAATGAPLPTGRGRAGPARSAARPARAGGTTPLRGVAAPSPTHGLRPAPLGAIRVALVVGGLQRSAVPVARPVLPNGRTVQPPIEAPLLTVVAPRVPPTVRTARSTPLVPVMVPEGPVAQDRQAAEEGPLLSTRVPTTVVVREAIRVAGLPFALVAIRLGPTMAIKGNGVVEAVWLPPPRVALHEVRLQEAQVDVTAPTHAAHVPTKARQPTVPEDFAESRRFFPTWSPFLQVGKNNADTARIFQVSWDLGTDYSYWN